MSDPMKSPDRDAADETVKPLRMDAYYYGFAATGVPEIDRILSAIACAGKSFHYTADWHDEAEPWDGHAGSNPIEWIQNAANDAAKAASELATLRRREQDKDEAIRRFLDMIEARPDVRALFGLAEGHVLDLAWQAISPARRNSEGEWITAPLPPRKE